VEDQLPPVGWAVQDPSGRLVADNDWLEWVRRQDVPKALFWGALVIWNALGMGLLLFAAFGDPSQPTATRDVVFNVVLWPLLVGDLALATTAVLGQRMRKRQRT
jgi:hypothetical protein